LPYGACDGRWVEAHPAARSEQVRGCACYGTPADFPAPIGTGTLNDPVEGEIIYHPFKAAQIHSDVAGNLQWNQDGPHLEHGPCTGSLRSSRSRRPADKWESQRHDLCGLCLSHPHRKEIDDQKRLHHTSPTPIPAHAHARTPTRARARYCFITHTIGGSRVPLSCADPPLVRIPGRHG
jgi:hypothetical protein